MIRKIRKSGALSVLLCVFIYCVVGWIKNSPSIPSAQKLLESAFSIFTSSSFYENLLYTVKIVITGVTISLCFGCVIATICSMIEPIRDVVMPVINATKNIPSIALFPLFIILMGIGDQPRIAVIIWNSIYPIISSTMAGLNSSGIDVIEAAENCGATKWETYKYIRIPLALVSILEGLKICVGNGFIAIVVAEMLGATKGLGYMVLWSSNAFKYADMYVYILVIALIGLAVNVVIEKLISFTERKVFE